MDSEQLRLCPSKPDHSHAASLHSGHTGTAVALAVAEVGDSMGIDIEVESELLSELELVAAVDENAAALPVD